MGGDGWLPRSQRIATLQLPNKAIRSQTGGRHSLLTDVHPRPWVILIDDFALFEARRVEIEAAVKHGATAIFMELPAGEHVIGGDTIKLESCGMGGRHFVSRATGHPLVADFQPEDFRLWYDSAADRIAPLLETCFQAEGWTPILTTGNGGWGGEWGPALAAAEKRDGTGSWRICQVALAGRTVANPVAALFARRLTGRAGRR